MLLTISRIDLYIGAVAAYAAEEVVKQLPVGGQPLPIEADKVGGWLMNQDATSWENVGIPQLVFDRIY